MRQIIHYIKEVSTYNQVCTKEVLTFRAGQKCFQKFHLEATTDKFNFSNRGKKVWKRMFFASNKM